MEEKENKINRIAYIIHGERPDNAILEIQVYFLFSELKKKYKEFDITIYLFAHPLILAKNLSAYQRTARKVKAMGLHIKILPLIVIPERYEMRRVWICKLSLFFNWLAYRSIKYRKYDTIICRSYLSAYYYSSVQRTTGTASNIVFDPRSVYPLERYSFGFFKSEKLYAFWLKRERVILEWSRKIISIGIGMTDYFLGVDPMLKNKISELPISYGPNSAVALFPENDQVKESIKKQKKNILLYVGSLTLGKHNNDAVHYINRCSAIASANKGKVHFVFVLSSVDENIKQLFLSNEVLKDCVTFYSGKAQVYWWLKNADFGIYFLHNAMDSSTRYGVKSVEYLSNGLPMIIDKGAGGISTVLSEYKMGINIDNEANLNDLDQLFFDRDAIKKWACEKHSINSNIQRLREILSF